MKYLLTFLELSNRPVLSAKKMSCTLFLSLSDRNFRTSILFAFLRCRIDGGVKSAC